MNILDNLKDLPPEALQHILQLQSKNTELQSKSSTLESQNRGV